LSRGFLLCVAAAAAAAAVVAIGLATKVALWKGGEMEETVDLEECSVRCERGEGTKAGTRNGVAGPLDR
jgi:hypothetical protein